MVRFSCQWCGTRLQVSEANAGKQGRCPRCKNKLTVPLAPETELELVREDTPATPPPSKLLDQLAVQPPPLPVSEDRAAPESWLTQKMYAAISAEPTGERKLPWPVDILLYPMSLGGVLTLVILLVTLLLLDLLPLGIAGMLIGAILGLYYIWYLAECVYDSAKGGTRAPMALETTDPEDMWSRAAYLLLVCLVYVAPAVIYWGVMRRPDTVLWALTGWMVIFFPMGLLAMVIHDTSSVLNPLFLLGAILRTFLPYVGLLVLLAGLGGLHLWIQSRLANTAFVDLLQLSLAMYMSFVLAHVLGRFYWRYRERLDWGI